MSGTPTKKCLNNTNTFKGTKRKSLWGGGGGEATAIRKHAYRDFNISLGMSRVITEDEHKMLKLLIDTKPTTEE